MALGLRAVVFVVAAAVGGGGVGASVAVSASSHEALKAGPAGEVVDSWFRGCGAGCHFFGVMVGVSYGFLSGAFDRGGLMGC